MSIETMTKLATVTVGSGGAANIEFTNIPQTYTDLLVKLSVRTTRTGTDVDDEIFLEFNGSGGTAYSTRMIEGNGSTARSASDTSQAKLTRGVAPTDNSTASTFSNCEYYIPNYASSNNKSVSFDSTMETNATYSIMSISAGLWSNSAAITSMKFTAYGTFDQHSTATLYGVKAYRLAVPNPPAVPPIPGYSLWLDASNLGSIKYSTSNNISQWNDLSGNNNNAVQANAALQPTFEQSVLNNKPVIRFNTTKLLKTGTRFGGQAQTTFMVINTASGIDNGSTGAGSPLYSSLGQVTNLIAGGMAFGNWTGGYSNERINWGVQTSGNSTNGVAYTSANISSGGHTLCFSTGSSGSGRDIKLDNSSLSLTAVNNWTTSNYPGNYDCIGNTDSATDGFQGDIAEIIFYPTQLSTSEITAVHTYLKAKWGTL